MLKIKNTIVTLDIFQEQFFCDLPKCKGLCCVKGDYGAPLNEMEIFSLKKNIEKIKAFMNKDAVEHIEKYGFYETDPDDDQVTKCIKGEHCVFVIQGEDGIYKCAIEKAWQNGKIDFQKPISCHLYPIRINSLAGLEGVTYNRWDICKSACELGKKKKIPLFKFLKDPLIRKFGKEWYKELEIVAEEVNKYFESNSLEEAKTKIS
ncbi:MAG: DUF3109 family protein [Bacteroidota bacterium]|nr:DUF3109 family protein [Bacteroidota bacterium]